MKTNRTRRAGSRLLVAAAVAGLILAASGCGGSSSTSATEQWANGVCSAFTTWKTSLEGIKTDLTSGGLSSLNSTTLTNAATKADDATKTLVQSIKKLGLPETTNGQTAKQNVTALEKTLSTSLTSIENAVQGADTVSGVATAVATVGTEFGTMANALTQSIDTLKQMNPGSDLEKAFKQASACKPYVSP